MKTGSQSEPKFYMSNNMDDYKQFPEEVSGQTRQYRL